MYINHLTLRTGNVTRIERGDVDGETLARVAPWLAALVESRATAPLPVAGLAKFSAAAFAPDGALVVTISGRVPLVTMGVAKRSRHGAALWPLLSAPHMPPVKRNAARPAEPWCAVAIWPSITEHPDALAWLGDLERCIAWAWCTRAEDGP